VVDQEGDNIKLQHHTKQINPPNKHAMKVYNFDRETTAGALKFAELLNSDSLLFQEIEKEFNAWIEGSNPANEYQEMYFGDDAIYSKSGAIQDAIRQIFEVMDEENLIFITTNDHRLDFDASFQ